MSAPSPSRRLIAGTAVSGLLLGGLAIVGAASAAGVCPTYTDPAGDASYGQNIGQPEPEPADTPLTDSDKDLDIIDVSHSVDAGVFSTKLHMTAINATGAFFNFSDRYASSFTVNGKAVTVTVDRDYTASETMTGAAVEKGVLAVGGTATTAKVTVKVDVKASTITSLISVEDVEKALGGSVIGQPFTKMVSVATLTLPPAPPTRDIDTATAPATASYVFGGSCTGGSVPTPVPTATEEPEEEPEEEPSPSPTPSGTPSEEPEEEEEETEEPTGPPALFDQPRAGCFVFKDAAGDAKPGRSGVGSPNNDDDLDLTEIAVKSPADSLQVFAKVAKLGTAPATPAFFTGHSFTAALSVGGKAITVSATKAGAATSTPATLKATAVFDTKASNVVFTLPKADLEAILGAPLTAGTPVTGLTLTSNATNPAGSFDGDTATGAKPEEKTYAYGDNTCFQPPVGKLTLEGATAGVFSDKATVSATLLDTADAAVEGAKVTLALTGATVLEGTTNEDGEVVFTFPITVPAGAKKLTAAFLGNATVGPASFLAPFTVKSEKAVLKAVAGRGTVTATLTDDDKTALAGQTVVFTIGSKVVKVKTNAKGVAVLTRQTKGATVKVSFAAVKDRYTAAPTVSTKVL